MWTPYAFLAYDALSGFLESLEADITMTNNPVRVLIYEREYLRWDRRFPDRQSAMLWIASVVLLSDSDSAVLLSRHEVTLGAGTPQEVTVKLLL